jgi:spermidine synthase
MKIDMQFLPDGSSGDWAIESFIVPEKDFSQVISLFKTGRGVPAGSYKRLKRGSVTVMSNTPDEIRDFMHFVRASKGSILINGLGMGCIIKSLLDKTEITKITVIEKSPDVIKLVAPYFTDPRLIIINADAFEYTPPKGEKYDFVWHDIWDYICADNLPEMTKLHRKYARKTSWQDSWAKDLCKQQNRRGW